MTVLKMLAPSTVGLTMISVLIAAESVSGRPSILLVTADDLGLQMGCYGDEIAHTPHLDRFAAEGIRFTRAFVTQASCSSSRSSMLTGLYPHQNGQIGLSHRGYSMSDPSISTLPGELSISDTRASGEYIDCFTDKFVSIEGRLSWSLPPWGYLLLTSVKVSEREHNP